MLNYRRVGFENFFLKKNIHFGVSHSPRVSLFLVFSITPFLAGVGPLDHALRRTNKAAAASSESRRTGCGFRATDQGIPVEHIEVRSIFRVTWVFKARNHDETTFSYIFGELHKTAEKTWMYPWRQTRPTNHASRGSFRFCEDTQSATATELWTIHNSHR